MARVLIVDDHPVVREGLRAVLSTEPDFTVVGDAGDGATGLRRAGELRPDIILIDLALPDMDGVEVIRSIKQIDPSVRVVVLTAYDADERIVEAIRAGAQGYLLKGTPREELLAALRVVAQGGSVLQPAIAGRLLVHLRQLGEHGEIFEPLTVREVEVLQLMAHGARNKDIANRLCITERTVKFHMAAIFQKLGARSRTEALAKAIQRGLVRL